MASKIEHPIIRRTQAQTDLYEIVELQIGPGTPETLTVSARNPRKAPKEQTMELQQALLLLCPWLTGDAQRTPDGNDQDLVGMVGTIDGQQLENVLLVCEGLCPFPLRVRLWNIIRSLRTTGDVPELGQYGASCEIFELEDGLDLTHLEVQLKQFKVVFSRQVENAVSVSILRDFGQVFDDRQLQQVARFSAGAIHLLNKYGVKYIQEGLATEALEDLAHEHDLSNI